MPAVMASQIGIEDLCFFTASSNICKNLLAGNTQEIQKYIQKRIVAVQVQGAALMS